ncbi:formylmethanofuran dehydrogenase [Azohydromonas sediminis]|uniref:formylmethanofuran dehydrogenase n=1 Tax=Azohydromonas sediminis TaxID=2259674 RepID=UPI000E65D555|nr:formylmethanofuran dehydrogenase [Azohydromonas sediminis]
MPASLAIDRASSPPADWTCPFCALLCEGWTAPAQAAAACPRARQALDADLSGGDCPPAMVDGQAADLDGALDVAASRLARWRQPLFAGLGTDIAGVRALYRLAVRVDAICDHADGRALMHGLRALQDRGQFTATLAEVRSRADLIVVVGTDASAYPLLFRRFGVGEPGSPCRRVVFVGARPTTEFAGVAVDVVPGSGDLFADLQQLAALVAGRTVSGVAALAELAAALHASSYAVLVWEGARLPDEGALLVEALNRIVGTLNRHTRAATFGLGGSDGGHSVNQTLAWLSGLPSRTRVSVQGLQHEPRLFDTARLLADGAVDGVMWISSFDAVRLPPAAAVPRIVLGPPAMAARLRDAGALADTVFVAVATPGLHAEGHLFRIDGPVVLPLQAASRGADLPGVAAVLDALAGRLAAAGDAGVRVPASPVAVAEGGR